MSQTILLISTVINFIFIFATIVISLRKGGSRYFQAKISNFINPANSSFDEIFPPYYIHRSSQFAALTQSKQKIILLGDSLTDEGEWTELLDNPHVLNRGISGDTTIRVYKRLPAIIASQPQKLFLLIGVNDLINTSKSLEEIIHDYRQLIDEITKKIPEVELFLQSILPVNNDVVNFLQDNQNILQLNQNIQAIAQEYDCKYIDIYSHLCDNQNQLDSQYTSDGVHLNGDAYMIWARVIKQYLH